MLLLTTFGSLLLFSNVWGMPGHSLALRQHQRFPSTLPLSVQAALSSPRTLAHFFRYTKFATSVGACQDLITGMRRPLVFRACGAVPGPTHLFIGQQDTRHSFGHEACTRSVWRHSQFSCPRVHTGLFVSRPFPALSSFFTLYWAHVVGTPIFLTRVLAYG